jgi:BON domain-containing protein
MRKAASVLGMAAIGASLGWYLFDPRLGRRRRDVIRDTAVRAIERTAGAADARGRDFADRTRGVVAGIRSRLVREPVADDVLEKRVRSRIAALASAPDSIVVAVDHGRVTLSGPVLGDEVDRLVRRVAALPGVTEVDNCLEPHAEPGNVPGLQRGPGSAKASPRLIVDDWAPPTRVLSAAAAGAIAGVSLSRLGLGTLVVATLGVAAGVRAVLDSRFIAPRRQPTRRPAGRTIDAGTHGVGW